MNYFISGGCKNGKSTYAQQVAKKMSDNGNLPLYYVATMIPHDEEDEARVKRHIADRDGMGFMTLEQPRSLCECLRENVNPQGVFLVDSITALLSNEMFREDGTVDFDAGKRVIADVSAFTTKTGNAVFVSDYIYSDARQFDSYTEKYRKSLAAVDRQLATLCDQVVEVAFGMKYFYKDYREGEKE